MVIIAAATTTTKKKGSFIRFHENKIKPTRKQHRQHILKRYNAFDSLRSKKISIN